MSKLNCKQCEYRKPKCKEGKQIYKKMTARLLRRGLDMDEAHMKMWKEWINHG